MSTIGTGFGVYNIVHRIQDTYLEVQSHLPLPMDPHKHRLGKLESLAYVVMLQELKIK